MAHTNNPTDRLKRLSVLVSFLFCLEILCEMPNDNAGRDGNVEGVLGAELGNLQAAVRGIDNLLMNAFNLIAEDNSIFLVRSGREVLQHRGAVGLLDREDLIALRLQLINSFQSRWIIVPGDAVLSPKGGLVDLCMRRRGGDATETDSLNEKGIRGTENTAHVVHGADIVKNDHQWQFLSLTELLYREPLHLYRTKLFQR